MRHFINILAAALLTCATLSAQDGDKAGWRLRFLTDRLCEGRATGTRGGVLAGMWIAEEFARIGLQPLDSSYFHGFTATSGETGRNIVGLAGGSEKGSRRRYIVVGAHYDHIGTLGGTLYPGADSNASGVVSLLDIADRVRSAGRKGFHSVLFVAFDAKLHGMAGSKEMVRLLREGALKDPETGQRILLRNVDFMINIDQVGSTAEPLASGRKDYLMMLSDERTGRRQTLIALNSAGPRMDISFSYYGSRDFTDVFFRKAADQKAFLDAGIPSVMFTSGITMYNNKPTDTAEVIDFPILRKRINLIYSYFERLL